MKHDLQDNLRRNTIKKTLVPEARETMDKFKMEAASDVGVNLKQGYNGDLTAKQVGSIGGQSYLSPRNSHRRYLRSSHRRYRLSRRRYPQSYRE
ncbi:MAG: alpha/beta-type small acid-soluble spore protein [Clostridia bacterium]|nr:alpha/beta-type small acid-soluble spore protein [Clostridia bacterium]